MLAYPELNQTGLLLMRASMIADGQNEMPEKIPLLHFELIFNAGFQNFAAQSFRFTVPSFAGKDQYIVQHSLHEKKLRIMLQKLSTPVKLFTKIALPTVHGLEMIAVDSIISCSSERNYTIVHLKNNKKIVVSRNLKAMEDMLSGYPFFRVHHSFIVNLNEISKYMKDSGGYLLMNEGNRIEISRGRKEALLSALRQSE